MPMKKVICCKFSPSQLKTDQPCSLRSFSEWVHADSVRGISKLCLNRLSANRPSAELCKKIQNVIKQKCGSDKSLPHFFLSILSYHHTFYSPFRDIGVIFFIDGFR